MGNASNVLTITEILSAHLVGPTTCVSKVQLCNITVYNISNIVYFIVFCCYSCLHMLGIAVISGLQTSRTNKKLQLKYI